MMKNTGQALYPMSEDDLDHVTGGVDWPIGYGPTDGPPNGGCEEEPPVRL